MTPVEIVSGVLIGAGLLLGVVSAVGLNRFDGVLMRIHAASKPQVLGLILVFSGAALAARSWTLAGLLLVVLLAQMLTVPVSSVMVGRAAFRRGFVRGGDYAIDELSPRLADAGDEDDDEDGFLDEEGDDHRGMIDGAQDRFPENVVTVTSEPLTDPNWEEPEGGADRVEDEDVIDIDLYDETEREAEEVAERDARP
ncbi:cation:proton antiporter [Brachybacterium saurashtrense]|uniref:Monovalent cation/H(+) antiporter subunit G n=1 Tax=Brachybacterium saurashtrense TaxID=556288 RepID=A0A345YPW8_9MICO|nr:monovalent cation/H(+) antiporter subunit G [Brachybacterium saurashtrense]AXK45970.1 monovalent cation/H(+) antiporter subunit G [Brachybacterium saurashtrense]RRR23709.1 monovalent cation/H(+) antiporter subunit G [Brachybacterium saurashtrense]